MTTKDIVYIALFAALTAALGIVPPIPTGFGINITAQSLGVMLAGSLAGARRGGLAMMLFLALIAIGLPLLAGGRGGMAALVGPWSGYVLAWPLCAFLIGALLARRKDANVWLIGAIIAFGGIVVMHAFGIVWYAIFSEIPLGVAFVNNSIFIPGDLVKVVIAALLTNGLRRAYPNL
ncbi:Biotin transporter BioY [Shimia sp. SK013]|uniref:biotin transporter BioY n=1 Tax=Shimia sp. SK013 TaxID=1389006 RepID=UPI0006B5A141|nr:biotin transporter BioY [Shimia sp. SK013]KPA23606.1 Biotin transporter BioY [Shimia sp. SK013]